MTRRTPIRGPVSRRDAILDDDFVTVYFDTYDDRRRAYVFSFNPRGVQSDGIYTEGITIGRNFDGNIDRSWDGVLTSVGRIGETGYVVEAAIPFATLRFASTTETRWGSARRTMGPSQGRANLVAPHLA